LCESAGRLLFRARLLAIFMGEYPTATSYSPRVLLADSGSYFWPGYSS
jgi:hypothetical protein